MSLIDEARHHIETADKIGTTKPMTEYHLQLALVKSQLALAEQQRIANKLTVALVEQIGSFARTNTQPGYAEDPAVDIRVSLIPDEWKELDL